MFLNVNVNAYACVCIWQTYLTSTLNAPSDLLNQHVEIWCCESKRTWTQNDSLKLYLCNIVARRELNSGNTDVTIRKCGKWQDLKWCLRVHWINVNRNDYTVTGNKRRWQHKSEIIKYVWERATNSKKNDSFPNYYVLLDYLRGVHYADFNGWKWCWWAWEGEKMNTHYVIFVCVSGKLCYFRFHITCRCWASAKRILSHLLEPMNDG